MKVTKEWMERESRPTPVLYLDLDGTVRHGKEELGRFVNFASDVKVFDGVPAILAQYKAAGWRIVAVSNQGGIALNLVTAEDCAEAMLETYRQCDGLFDNISYCSHHPDSPDPEYAICWCRKPRIGLLINAATTLAAKYNEYYPPHLALLVGDRPEDQECAANAGIEFMNAEVWRGYAAKRGHDLIIADREKRARAAGCLRKSN